MSCASYSPGVPNPVSASKPESNVSAALLLPARRDDDGHVLGTEIGDGLAGRVGDHDLDGVLGADVGGLVLPAQRDRVWPGVLDDVGCGATGRHDQQAGRGEERRETMDKEVGHESPPGCGATENGSR